MSRSPQGLSFFKKRLCAIGWVVFFPFFFPHVPPLLSLPPKSLHQSYCGQCWERTAFKKKKYGSRGLALGQPQGPRVSQRDCLGC